MSSVKYTRFYTKPNNGINFLKDLKEAFSKGQMRIWFNAKKKQFWIEPYSSNKKYADWPNTHRGQWISWQKSIGHHGSLNSLLKLLKKNSWPTDLDVAGNYAKKFGVVMLHNTKVIEKLKFSNEHKGIRKLGNGNAPYLKWKAGDKEYEWIVQNKKSVYLLVDQKNKFDVAGGHCNLSEWNHPHRSIVSFIREAEEELGLGNATKLDVIKGQKWKFYDSGIRARFVINQPGCPCFIELDFV